MDDFEMDGVHAEIERLARLHQSPKPVYSDRLLSRRTPGTERLGAPSDDVGLTHDDLAAAQRELAEQHGVSPARVRGLVLLTAARAGLGHSEQEQAAVIAEVAMTMASGKMNVSDDQILALSCLGDVTAEPETGAGRDEAGPEPVALAGQSQETAAMALTGGADSAEGVISRHPELSHLFRAGKTSSRRHPRKSGPGREVTTASRAHASDTGDETGRDTRQPARGGEVHRGVRDIIEGNPELFTDGEGRDPSAKAAWPS